MSKNVIFLEKLAEELNITDQNKTWEEIVEKYSAKGLSGDAFYQEIINASTRSRTSVNISLGLQD